jgi:hypothetical protein
MRRGTFLAWLKSQVKRDDPVGDLARDETEAQHLYKNGFERYGQTPKTNLLSEMRNHLYHIGACTGAINALEKAWEEWCKENFNELSPEEREELWIYLEKRTLPDDDEDETINDVRF